ncbi:O-antigen ligase family protein [Clostridium algidicarnis]|uniref:O-antigen ligase-related domain-containing protein n=1 Tax=Clostridium algidicarnis TaxID=37659 RepID=A0ABS6C5C6_9CLOT|nr:O-antigen ligase family protein [Clostridium algidicarnis]MBU3220656.1 hypothetical protein [Clostridium algidicarnis]
MDKIVYSKDRKNLTDKILSISVMFPITILSIQYLILNYFNILGSNNGSIVQQISKSIVGLLFLVTLPKMLKRNWILFLFTYVTAIGLFLFNYIFFNQNTEILQMLIFQFYFMSLPCFIYSYSIDDTEILLSVMNKVSIIVFIVGVVISILVFTNRITIDSYSMSLSYYMLLPIIVFLNSFLKNMRLLTFTQIIISLIIILSLGSRGPLICIGFFIVSYLINNRVKLNYKSILIYPILLSLVIIIFIKFDDILSYTYRMFLQLGIRSRTLQMLMEKGLYLSGRETLYSTILDQIKQNPLLGIGIGGDRLYVGSYVHNIFLELLSHFGIIFGSIIIVFLFYLCYRMIKLKSKNDSNFMLMWISMGIIPLLVSGSYLIEFNFWIFLGLALKALKKDKNLKIKDIK